MDILPKNLCSCVTGWASKELALGCQESPSQTGAFRSCDNLREGLVNALRSSAEIWDALKLLTDNGDAPCQESRQRYSYGEGCSGHRTRRGSCVHIARCRGSAAATAATWDSQKLLLGLALLMLIGAFYCYTFVSVKRGNPIP